MAELLKGAAVAAAINEKYANKSADLRASGIVPTLAILRAGERDDALSYERGAVKRAEQLGVDVKKVVLPEDVPAGSFYEALDGLNNDPSVHGILVLQPLPKQIDTEKVFDMLLPEKDIDGSTAGSLAGVFTNKNLGFAPCTAQAVMEILKFYGIGLKGKKVAVIGRSLVIGRPVAMMLMHENATVTICHTKTEDIPAVTKAADIVVAASGQMESINKDYLSEGQILIDVGISWNDKKQKLCGDLAAEDADALAKAYTPVPGGVGAVTTSVLISHVVDAAEKTLK